MNVIFAKLISFFICLLLIFSQSRLCHRYKRHWKRTLNMNNNNDDDMFKKFLQTKILSLIQTKNLKDDMIEDSFTIDSKTKWSNYEPEKMTILKSILNHNTSSLSLLSSSSSSSSSYFENENNTNSSIFFESEHHVEMYEQYFDFTQNSIVHAIFIVLYILVMFSAVIGNILVCHTVLSNHKMQTVVNYYILNLALCDLLVGIFVLPSKAIEFLVPANMFSLNELLCSIFSFLQTVVVFASLLTLVATCFERYFAIVHPFKSRMQQSKRRTGRILLLVWTVSAIAAIPSLMNPATLTVSTFTSDYGNIHRSTCSVSFEKTFRKFYYTALFIFFYLLPLCLIAFTSFCIAKSLLSNSVMRRQGSLLRQEINRRKIGKMIVIVAACFTVTWTPYFVVTIITQYQSENFMQHHDYVFTMLCINLFAFLHSSINPLIYATMSTRFRQAFTSSIYSIFYCNHYSHSVATNLIHDQASSHFSIHQNGPRTDTCASNSSQTVRVNTSEYLPMLTVRQTETVWYNTNPDSECHIQASSSNK